MGRRIVTACKGTKEPVLKNETIFTATASAALPESPREQTTAIDIIPDDYKMKVIKYIPTEIVTVYVTLEGIIRASSQAPNGVYWMVFIILLILTPIYMWRITNQADQKPAWDQIIVAFFSFIIWAMALGGPFATLSWYHPLYPALLLPIFTLIVPLIKNENA